MLGGGMRQVGVLAAAGLVALDTMVDRLAEDHAARPRLAEGIRPVPGIGIPEVPETNILIFRVGPEWFAGERPVGGTSGPFLARMKERGILAVPVDAERVRFVTHYDLPADGIDRAIAAVAARG